LAGGDEFVELLMSLGEAALDRGAIAFELEGGGVPEGGTGGGTGGTGGEPEGTARIRRNRRGEEPEGTDLPPESVHLSIRQLSWILSPVLAAVQ